MRENLWENKKAKELGITNEEKDPKIKDTVDDQFIVGGRTDVSIEDFTDELNQKEQQRRVIGKENTPTENEESWEEQQRDLELNNSLSDLMFKYTQLKERIEQKEESIEMTTSKKENTNISVLKLNTRDMSSRERSSTLVDIMRNAEDRIERINNKLKIEHQEILPLKKELEGLDSMIQSISILMSNNGKDGEKYKFNLN